MRASSEEGEQAPCRKRIRCREALRTSARTAVSPPRTGAGTPEPSEGTRLVGAHLPVPVHRQLRMLAANEDRTMQSLLTEALNALFADRGLPPIA